MLRPSGAMGEAVALRIPFVLLLGLALPSSGLAQGPADESVKRAEADLLRPGRVFRDCPDVCPEMVVVPAGSFMMGSRERSSEGPQRTVTIARPFAVGKFEVTFTE